VDDDLLAAPVEAADELVALGGQVRGAQPHPVGGDVDRLGLEPAAGVLAHGDQRLEMDALPSARAPLLGLRAGRTGTLCATIAHTPSPPDRAGASGPCARQYGGSGLPAKFSGRTSPAVTATPGRDKLEA